MNALDLDIEYCVDIYCQFRSFFLMNSASRILLRCLTSYQRFLEFLIRGQIGQLLEAVQVHDPVGADSVRYQFRERGYWIASASVAWSDAIGFVVEPVREYFVKVLEHVSFFNISV